jgi:hypothetical protein
MEFGLAFSFPFRDPDWFKKIVLVALVSLIPIIGQLMVLGFGLEVMKRVINHDPVPLPDLDFGGFLVKGFLGFVIAFVYTIPIYIILIPVYVLPAITNASGGSNAGDWITILISCVCGGLSLIYAILISFMIPPAFGKYLTEDNFGAAFRFAEVFQLVRAAPVAILVALLGYVLVNFLSGFGVILCVIGVLLTSAYAYAVTGHLFGQAYLEATKA